MKKFLLFVALIIAVIVLICNLEWSLIEWCFILAGLLLLRALHLSIKSPDSGNLGYSLTSGASHLFGGGGLSWWEERWFVITDDYTSGSILSLIYKWAITILGGLAIIFLVIRGVIWLFGQTIFWIVIGSIVGVALLIFIGMKLKKSQREREEKEAREKEEEFREESEELVSEFVNEVGVPMPSGAINHNNFDYCVTAIQDLQMLKGEIEDPANAKNLWEIKRQLIDKKLEIFYKVSIPAQSKELLNIAPKEADKFMADIDKAIESKDFNLIRRPECDDKKITQFVNKLNKYTKLLKNNTMNPYLDELDKYKSMDTTALGGIVTSSSKLADKANIFRNIYEAAKKEYEELENIRDKVNYILESERLSSYKNIYLGVELLNSIRENAGGKKLSKSNDLVQIDLILNEAGIKNAGKNTKITDFAISSISNLFDKFTNDRNFSSFALENPKQALANETLELIGNAIRERNENISKNNEAIEQILTCLPKMVDAYTSGQAQILRAIEIIKSIIKANNGFEKIYAPLYDIVFVKNDVSSVTIKDVQILAGALKEFNTIAKANL